MKDFALTVPPGAAEDSAAHSIDESAVEWQRHFRALVEKYSALVVNTCYLFLRDADDAHDVAQEVFIAHAFFCAHSFSNTIGSSGTNDTRRSEQ